jgi:hypothetical protein
MMMMMMMVMKIMKPSLLPLAPSLSTTTDGGGSGSGGSGRWQRSPPVPPPPPLVEAEAAFPGSGLISPAQGVRLNDWANQTAGRMWELCYTTSTMAQTAAEFHKRCDGYKPTVTVARNSLNYTFGGFVRTIPSPPLHRSCSPCWL